MTRFCYRHKPPSRQSNSVRPKNCHATFFKNKARKPYGGCLRATNNFLSNYLLSNYFLSNQYLLSNYYFLKITEPITASPAMIATIKHILLHRFLRSIFPLVVDVAIYSDLSSVLSMDMRPWRANGIRVV